MSQLPVSRQQLSDVAQPFTIVSAQTTQVSAQFVVDRGTVSFDLN